MGLRCFAGLIGSVEGIVAMSRFTVTWMFEIDAPAGMTDETVFNEVTHVLEQLLATEGLTPELQDSTMSVDLVRGCVEISLDVLAESDSAAQEKSLQWINDAIEQARSEITFRMPALLSLL